MPQPLQDVHSRAPRAAAYLTDPGTDPGGVRRYDALFRESLADAPWRGPAVRQYEPSLRPPENASEDPFGWLYRVSEDTPAPPPAAQPPVAAASPAPASPEWVVAPTERPGRVRPGRVIVAVLALVAILVGAGTGAFIVAREH